MQKLLLIVAILGFTAITAIAQNAGKKKIPQDTTVTKNIDSTQVDVREDMADNIPIVSLDENDLGDGGSQNSSIFSARDPFYSAASFNFNVARFRMRGYEGDLNTTFMNGIPMDNLDNGFTPFGLWGGLNDVMRNRDVSLGLRANNFAFGDISTSTKIDSRASKQRRQTQVGYAISNRNYTHRFSVYHASGTSKKGWAYVVAGSFRGADEGYIPGTFYNGYSWFVGIDKRIGQKRLLSIVAFDALTENGRQSSGTKEMMDIAGDKYYNPTWGLQKGKVRNANVAKSNQPTIILTDENKLTAKTILTTALSATFGDRSTTALDWYNAPDPRPDYYRYLPSYQSGPLLQQQVLAALQADVNKRQINWQNLYDVNRNSIESFQNANGIIGNTVTGKRSHYIVEERLISTTRLNFNSVLNTTFGKLADFTAGISYQSQNNNYHKKVNDLLGGDFYVNLNQFAERDYPSNNAANQNDLNNPNRVLHVGDRFGYDYDIDIRKAQAFAQTIFKLNKVDLFVAGEISNTQFWRTGNVKNGLFPDNSFGKSSINEFTNFAVKGGVTYRLNRRNNFYLNAAYLTRAPLFDNVYISPRTRDVTQDNVTSENIKTIEGGYILNAPTVKARLTGYYTRFDNQLNVLTFYHDEFRNFVNYSLSNIDKVHFGGEFGIEAKVIKNVTFNAAAAVGRYYFDSRQEAAVTLDNNAAVLNKDLIYSQNYRVPGTPQEAYSAGFTYRSRNYWFAGITGNYFDKMWLDFNPLRRTFAAVDGLDINKPAEAQLRSNILAQTEFDPQYTVDFFGGYSWKLPRSYGFKKNVFVVFNVGVNNLLNNQNITSGGYEQLRFDFAEKNLNKFPPKLFYAYGLNYFASISVRF